MTTTASKAGLRAKATATRDKAAQRTPLPPKAGKVQAAKETIAAAKRVQEETPADKGAKYAALLQQAGWKPEVNRNDGLVELVATRGNGTEAIFLSWFKEAHISGASTYTYADRTVKVRNPAEAMRIANRPAEEAKANQAKVASNRQKFMKQSDGPSVRNVPFDVETVTDEEIVAALEARQISWHNQHRVDSESAIVGSAKNIHVSRHSRGHRIVSFIDPESGYRAFRLENLENVGRKVNLERIKQEILASLTKDMKRTERKAA